MIPAVACVLLAAFTLYSAVPPILRAIQLFGRSDLQFNFLRGVSILFLLLAAISFCVGAREFAGGRLPRSVIAVGVASLLIYCARYLIHSFTL